jgi:hypothetical protein
MLAVKCFSYHFSLDSKLVYLYTVLMIDVTTTRLRPKFRQLADERYRTQMIISRISGIPYQTVHTYYNAGHNLRGVRLNVLYGYLRGIGMSDEEILASRLGDLFDIVDDEAEETDNAPSDGAGR